MLLMTRTPPSQDLLFIIALTSTVYIVDELRKAWRRRRRQPPNKRKVSSSTRTEAAAPTHVISTM